MIPPFFSNAQEEEPAINQAATTSRVNEAKRGRVEDAQQRSFGRRCPRFGIKLTFLKPF